MSRKYHDIADLLRRRIESGDYHFAPLPSERRLAAELGVGYMTARRAIQKLIEESHLSRSATGRLQVSEGLRKSKRLAVAMVLPAFEASPGLVRWRNALDRVVSGQGGILRPVSYIREDDPALLEVFDAEFNGLFLIPPPRLSPLVRDRIAKASHRIVTIWHDLTELGVPCVSTRRPGSVDRLIDHLVGLEHGRIDCFNTQPMGSAMQSTIRDWSAAIEARGLEGQFHDYAVQPFQRADTRAFEVMRDLLGTGGTVAPALFCTTLEAAIGVQRAAFEQGLRIGADLSLATFGEPDRARLLTPSMTTVETPDPAPYMEQGLEWIRTGGKGWDRPLMIEPPLEAVGLFVGESTGPAPAAALASAAPTNLIGSVSPEPTAGGGGDVDAADPFTSRRPRS